MRILLTSHYGIPHLGGIEVIADALARGFAQQGHEVTHLFSTALRDDDPEPEVLHFPYRRAGLAALNVLERMAGIPYPIFGPSLPFRLWREVGRADVVHVHGLIYENSVLAAVIAGIRKKKLIVTEHVGEVPYRSAVLRLTQKIAFRTLGKLAARHAKVIIVVNNRVAAEMRALNGRVRIEKVGYGVDTERFHPPAEGEREQLRKRFGWDDGRRRLMLVGRIVEKKGIDVAIAAARLLGEAWELLLVGPGSVSSALPPNVRALGGKRVEEMAELYRSADALLLPSRGEGFPLAVQEALASGLPVFVPGDPEFRNVLEGLNDAARFFEANPASIADAVKRFFQAAPSRIATGNQAAAFARACFSWDAVVKRHLELYT